MDPAAKLLNAGPKPPLKAVTQSAFRCANCKRYNIATRPNQLETVDSVDLRDQTYANDGWNETTRWTPSRTATREYVDVPEHIADAATEATLCQSAGAFRAVGALARAVVEATAKDKGISQGTLNTKIDALASGGHIRDFVKEQAHHIRHFGNEMAHGDFTDPVSREDADEIVDLMSELLEEVYQAPARLARMQQNRAARKASGQS